VLSDRKRGIAAVVLSNNYAAGMVGDIAEAVVAIAQDSTPVPLRVHAPVDIDITKAARFAGRYHAPPGTLPLPPGSALEIRTSGRSLQAVLDGVPVDLLVPQGDGSFLSRTLWSLVEFRDAAKDTGSVMTIRPLYREGVINAVKVPAPRNSQRLQNGDADLYVAALKFFSPPRNQRRWLDSRLLTEGLEEASLDSEAMNYILRKLGSRFLPFEERLAQDERIGGGILRVGPIERISPERARVRVRYRHIAEGYEGTPVDLQFLLTKRGGAWHATKQ
jgi:hypothetical protein